MWWWRCDAAVRGVARRYMLGDDLCVVFVWFDVLVCSELDELVYFFVVGCVYLMMGDLEGVWLCFEAAEKKTAAFGEAATEV